MDEAFNQHLDKSEITLDLSSEDSINKALIEYAYFFWNAAWLESARLADRKARIECAEICDKLKAAGAWEAADAIRATIKEE